MQIEIRQKGKITIFEISGKMYEWKGAQEVCERFKTLLEKGERTFLFDLSKVPDSATDGINAVVACRNAALKRDGIVKLVLSERLRGLFTMLFLDKIFEIHDDLEEALVSFA